MTIMMRRLTIICLSAALFAVGLLTIVEQHERPGRSVTFSADHPCSQLDAGQCRTEL